MLRPGTGDSATPKIGFSLPVVEGSGGNSGEPVLAAGAAGAAGAAVFTAPFAGFVTGAGAGVGGGDPAADATAPFCRSCSSNNLTRCSMRSSFLLSSSSGDWVATGTGFAASSPASAAPALKLNIETVANSEVRPGAREHPQSREGMTLSIQGIQSPGIGKTSPRSHQSGDARAESMRAGKT